MNPRTWLIIGIGLTLMLATHNQKKEGFWSSPTTYEEAGFAGEAYDTGYETIMVNEATGTAGLAGASESRGRKKKGSSIWIILIMGGIAAALFLTGWSLLQNTWFMMISAGILVLAMIMR